MRFKVGEFAETSHRVTVADIELFAEVSGDKNPIHLDDGYAKDTQFGKRIAHGMFTASFFSGLFGTKLPGTGCLYVSQSLRFRKPVFVGDMVNARVTITAINSRKKTIEFDTRCHVNSKVVTSGNAEIYVSDLSMSVQN